MIILLFSVSVSVTFVPCGIINAHGLFGQLISSTITEDNDKSCFEERSVYENRKQTKGINILIYGFTF